MPGRPPTGRGRDGAWGRTSQIADHRSPRLAGCAPQGCEQGGGPQNPAIFWPCGGKEPESKWAQKTGHTRLEPSFHATSEQSSGRGVSRNSSAYSPATPLEILQLREEARDFNAWLRDELTSRFADVDRKLDLLDFTSCLQERYVAHFAETEKKLDMISLQVSRCEASISAINLPGKGDLVRSKSRLQGYASEASSTSKDRRATIASIESLDQHASGLFPNRNHFGERINSFLEDPESSIAARWYARFWPLFVMASAVVTLAQSLGQSFWAGAQAAACEVAIDAIFTLEVLGRYLGYPTTWGFFKSPYNVIDIIAALPLVLRAVVGLQLPDEGFIRFALLCWVPLLRLLKMLRWLKQFHLFARLLDDTKEALKFLLFLLFIIVLMFASLFYLVEPRTTVASLPQAMWFTIVTVTTVGYTAPATEAGHVVLIFLLISSVLYMAMPIGILGNAFTAIWKDRDLILLASRTADRLAQWGYGPQDLPQIFAIFDNEGKGELSVFEFRTMLAAMRVGLSDERVVEVFNMLDTDDGGSIDHKEFLKRLFPNSYYELYGSKRTRGSHGRDRLKRQGSMAAGSTPCSTPGFGSPTFGSGPSSQLARIPSEPLAPDPDGHPGARACVAGDFA